MRLPILICLAALSLSVPCARGAFSINTQFAELFGPDGITGIGAGKIGLLVADEGAVPGLADPYGTHLALGNYLGGNSDDLIIAILTSVANVGGTDADGYQAFLSSIEYAGNFVPGNDLYLIWFPTLTAEITTVGAGVAYGAYRSDGVNVASGSDIAFVAPPDGSTSDLFAYLGTMAVGSEVTAADFTAKFLTVPEPSALWLFAGAGAVWLLVRRRAGRSVLFVLAAAGGMAGPARAQFWNVSAGNWNEAESWEGGAPVSGEDTFIGNGGAATVSAGPVAHSYGMLGIAGSSHPSAVLVVANATLDANGGEIRLGYSVTPDLEDVVGLGEFTVSGFQAKLINSGALRVGFNAGPGQLVIEGGGTVASASGHLGYADDTGSPAPGSTATIAGAGSTWTAGSLVVSAGAALVVKDGGRMVSPGGVLASQGAAIRGNGTIDGAISLGGTISTNDAPGTLTSGAQTWSPGGRYIWSVSHPDPLLEPGDTASWSLLRIQGALAVVSTPLDPFVIDLRTFTGGGSPGALAGFDPARDYHWVIATAEGGINAFTVDQFLVDADGFANPHTGAFSVLAAGDDLVLRYAAVPEVPTAAGSVAMLAALVVLRNRSRFFFRS